MAHSEQLAFFENLKQKHKNYFVNVSVLEVGSLNINGSIRSFFENCFYIGLDIAPGPCVDVVCLGHEYKIPDDTFDVIVSTESFEHDPHWEKTFVNMIRMCKSNGLVAMTCASVGRPEHGTENNDPTSSPLTVQKGWNYYKNLTENDFEKFGLNSMFSEFNFSRNDQHHDLYFYGIKK